MNRKGFFRGVEWIFGTLSKSLGRNALQKLKDPLSYSSIVLHTCLLVCILKLCRCHYLFSNIDECVSYQSIASTLLYVDKNKYLMQ